MLTTYLQNQMLSEPTTEKLSNIIRRHVITVDKIGLTKDKSEERFAAFTFMC